MACSCSKKKVASQPKKISRSQSKPISSKNSTLKRIIKRPVY